MVNTALTDPFDRVKTYSIGFDRMFDRLLDDSLVTTTNYPPYNIVKMDEPIMQFRLQLLDSVKTILRLKQKRILFQSSLKKRVMLLMKQLICTRAFQIVPSRELSPSLMMW